MATKQRSFLSQERFYRLTEALKEKREVVSQHTPDEVAARFEQELGFALSAGNVKNAAKIAGVELKRRRRSSRQGVQNLRTKVAQLELAMRAIAEGLGDDFDKMIANYVSKQNGKSQS